MFTAIPVLLSTYRTLSNTDWYLLVPASYWYLVLLSAAASLSEYVLRVHRGGYTINSVEGREGRSCWTAVLCCYIRESEKVWPSAQAPHSKSRRCSYTHQLSALHIGYPLSRNRVGYMAHGTLASDYFFGVAFTYVWLIYVASRHFRHRSNFRPSRTS